MSILTDNEILAQMDAGFIQIKPFNLRNLNPNSYDLTLNSELQKYRSKLLDPKDKKSLVTKKIKIPENGLTLKPGDFYLARTNEYTVTQRYVPTLHGKSGIGRMGLGVSNQAGYGDNGFAGYWTLQLIPSCPVIIYPNMKIVQIQYEGLEGIQRRTYSGHYQNSDSIVPSRIYEDINEEHKKGKVRFRGSKK